MSHRMVPAVSATSRVVQLFGGQRTHSTGRGSVQKLEGIARRAWSMRNSQPLPTAMSGYDGWLDTIMLVSRPRAAVEFDVRVFPDAEHTATRYGYTCTQRYLYKSTQVKHSYR